MKIQKDASGATKALSQIKRLLLPQIVRTEGDGLDQIEPPTYLQLYDLACSGLEVRRLTDQCVTRDSSEASLDIPC